MNNSSKRMWFRTGFVGALIVSLVFLAGCGGGSKKAATLSGKVTYPTADKPVTGGNITLHPASGQSLSSAIKPDGTYSIGGVPAGEMKVTVETESIKGMSGNPYPMQAPAGMKAPSGDKQIQLDTSNMPKYVKIPRKYADAKTTTLNFNSETTGAQTKDFNLTD